MSTHTTSDFARDTAVERVADGLWRAEVKPSWFVTTGPNGGWVAAVATRAMLESAGDATRPPRSLTLHFLESPDAGPLDIACAVERAGGTTTALSLRLSQGGRPVALGLGACSAWREGEPEWSTARPPDMPPVEQAMPVPARYPGAPPVWANYEGRAATGIPGSGAESYAAGWIRTAGPHPRDAVLLAALTDAWVPPAFVHVRDPIAVPTLDLTIHWRAPLREDGAHPWTFGTFRTRVAAGGFCEEDGELWSEDGTLLAQSRQLAVLRRVRP